MKEGARGWCKHSAESTALQPPQNPRTHKTPETTECPTLLTCSCEHLYLLRLAQDERHMLQHMPNVVTGLRQPIVLHVPARRTWLPPSPGGASSFSLSPHHAHPNCCCLFSVYSR